MPPQGPAARVTEDRAELPSCPAPVPPPPSSLPPYLLLQRWMGSWGALPAPLPPCSHPLGWVPAEPARAGAAKLARPFPRPALPGPAGLSSSPWPPKTRVPPGFPAVPAGVGGQGFEPQSLSPRAVPKRAPDVWARPCPSFLRAGSPQEQSQEEGDARSPFPGRGAISQLLLLCRPPGKPSLLQQSSSSGNSSDTCCRHSRRGGSESAW